MWQVENRTPFAAERGWVRDQNGAEVWVVAVKCTFDVQPNGSTEVSRVQPQVLRAPDYHGEPGASSLKYEADLVLTKTTTDVLLTGHAYAPNAIPTTGMDVGFRVGRLYKVLKVIGDRVWTKGGVSSPKPFVKMPLVYERAFGGVDTKSERPDRDWDWRNPIGTGFVVSGDHLDGVALPNFEYENQRFRAWSDRPRPAGFGPIASHWQPRVGFAGTYDDAWMRERQPLLPKDFDTRFFQCAPQDQQTERFLRGGEPVVLHGLTASGDTRFFLPKVFLGFETRFYDGSREIHRLRKLHSLIIDTDGPRVSLVWHTALPCHVKVHKLQRTIVTLKTDLGLGEPIDSDELELA